MRRLRLGMVNSFGCAVFACFMQGTPYGVSMPTGR